MFYVDTVSTLFLLHLRALNFTVHLLIRSVFSHLAIFLVHFRRVQAVILEVKICNGSFSNSNNLSLFRGLKSCTKSNIFTSAISHQRRCLAQTYSHHFYDTTSFEVDIFKTRAKIGTLLLLEETLFFFQHHSFLRQHTQVSGFKTLFVIVSATLRKYGGDAKTL